uniref:Uncharacterized protein n=1 Tax=Tanacetum cinerariifolium TaxID=118510 RepID=A0A6L2JE65_TANCI|nr:hypothetical protein [Tanacetum cinerariifolium]
MELVPEPHKASEFAAEDVISTMPDNVITNILDYLPRGRCGEDWYLVVQNYNCGDFIACCPLIENLRIFGDETTGTVKLVEIAKLGNLKMLSLSLCMLDNMAMITSSSIFQLKILPKLQELGLNLGKCQLLAEASVDEKVPTIFPCLKTLTLSIVNFSSASMLSFVTEMICGSTKLQNLNITATYIPRFSRRALPSLDLDYNTIGQLQLQCVVFSSFRGTENEHYPGRVGSMAPFALRWLYAELRSRVGDRQESVDRFYMLLDYVREKMRKKASGSDDIWRKREGLVINSIISHHLSHKEFGVCLELIKDLMKHDETAVGRTVLMSKLGYIQMQLGDLEGAKASFNVVEGIVNEEKMQFEMKNLVNRNKALMFMVGKDYVSAVLKALESVPTAALNETLVVNLCSMYELAYVNHTDTKKTLSNWIARVAPDDFDSSCTRV